MTSQDDMKKELKEAIIKVLKPYIIKEIKLELDKREDKKKKDFYEMSFL